MHEGITTFILYLFHTQFSNRSTHKGKEHTSSTRPNPPIPSVPSTSRSLRERSLNCVSNEYFAPNMESDSLLSEFALSFLLNEQKQY